jgi:hypothetical protein
VPSTAGTASHSYIYRKIQRRFTGHSSGDEIMNSFSIWKRKEISSMRKLFGSIPVVVLTLGLLAVTAAQAQINVLAVGALTSSKPDITPIFPVSTTLWKTASPPTSWAGLAQPSPGRTATTSWLFPTAAPTR